MSNQKKNVDSDIIHLNAAGTSMIVLNSVQAAKDLMEKRSSIYSTRYVLTRSAIFATPDYLYEVRNSLSAIDCEHLRVWHLIFVVTHL